MKSMTQKKTCLLLLFIGLFLFQDKLQDWFESFQYFDEFFALLIVPAFLVRLAQKRNPLVWNRKTILFFVLLATFWLFGWAGHFVYQYQPLSEAAKDAYVNLKFFMALGAAYLMFEDEKLDIRQMKKTLWPILYAVTVILFVLCIADLMFGIFGVETRGGLRTIKLFYSAYTVLVGHCVFLSAIYLWFYEERKEKIIPPLLMLSLIMFFTRRVKAVGAIACIMLLYLLVLRRQQKISRKVKIFAGCVLVFATGAALFQVISYYYVMGVESARAVLTIAAPYVAADHFPFGSGWATFGSAFSAEPYSPVYGMYRMAGVWGLSPDFHDFVSDTYWPMLLGECGYFGFAAFIGVLVLFVEKVLTLKTDKACLASALTLLLYLLISSTSESALANPMAVPLALWIGFLLAVHQSQGTAERREMVS